MKGGKWVAVTSMDTKNVIIYDLDQNVPKLMHLCRLVVRRSIAFRYPLIAQIYLAQHYLVQDNSKYLNTGLVWYLDDWKLSDN